MARMIPDFSRHIDKAPPFRKTGNPELDRGRQTEKELYIFLRDLLPDNWVVRYSFEFTRRTDELIEHEADFVVVIPRCGVLVLEVKASESYGLRNGVWYFDPECRHVREGNPFSQARATRFELKRKMQDYMHKSFPGLFGSIVVFPNARRIPGENAAPSSQDPDIIMLGEIRDLESARMAVEASLTGHFVFSTLHTNDAAGTVTRLIDMGVEPFLITSSLQGVVGQRLIRRICPRCKASFVPTDEDLALLGLDRADVGDNKFYYGKGCQNCNNTGYKGRKALTEMFVMHSQLIDLVLQSSPTVVLRDKARELGMITMREDGIQSVLNGETTMEEVLRYT